MLIRLLPEQVMEFWDDIKYALQKALPEYENNDNTLLNMQASFLGNLFQCWIYKEGEDTIAILATRVIENSSNGENYLEIVSLTSFTELKTEHWIKGYEALNKYATKRNCRRIIGLTDEELIKQIAVTFGGEVRSYISIPVRYVQ